MVETAEEPLGTAGVVWPSLGLGTLRTCPPPPLGLVVLTSGLLLGVGVTFWVALGAAAGEVAAVVLASVLEAPFWLWSAGLGVVVAAAAMVDEGTAALTVVVVAAAVVVVGSSTLGTGVVVAGVVGAVVVVAAVVAEAAGSSSVLTQCGSSKPEQRQQILKLLRCCKVTAEVT